MKNFRIEFNCYNPHLPCGNSFEIMATYFLEKIYFQARNRRAAEAIVEALLLYNEKIENALGHNPIISNNGVIEDVYLFEEDGTKHFSCEIEGDMDRLNFKWSEKPTDINKKAKTRKRIAILMDIINTIQEGELSLEEIGEENIKKIIRLITKGELK